MDQLNKKDDIVDVISRLDRKLRKNFNNIYTSISKMEKEDVLEIEDEISVFDWLKTSVEHDPLEEWLISKRK